MIRRAPGAAIVLCAMLLLSACGGDAEEPAGANPSIPVTYEQSYAGINVSGIAGKQPTIEVTEASQPATELGVVDLVVGDGPAVEESSIVTVDYVGVAESTGEIFDTTYDGGAPVTFGVSQVIQGWQDGLLGMQTGGTRMLVIPGELAYGEQSPGPGIGPNETLIFVIDLISVQ